MTNNFHETPRGARFFDAQLPALIKNLSRIADAMERQEQRSVEPSKAPTISEELSKRLTEVLHDSEFAANLGNVVREETASDDTHDREVGRQLAKAILNSDVDGILIAICGWNIETLLNKASSDYPKELEGLTETKMPVRAEMMAKVRKYITADTHRLEDFSDIFEICCEKDKQNACMLMDGRLCLLSDEELAAFCKAIDAGTVSYEVHGCR
ncbi:MAG: hypothetical protein IKA41_08715 [Bacteroidaceae bacterium]|nr:hypothetical protein [Bacteroidaceae bacterium]